MKKFKSFKDFVKEDRGIEVPEIEEEIIEEEEEVKTVDDGIKEFRKIAHESAVEVLEEQKEQNIPVPVVVTAEQIKRNNRILIVDQINEVLKHRDPILEKMTFQEWVKDPLNKIIVGLSEYHAQRLYEQDMDRADKVQAAGRASGGGVRKKKVTVVEEPALDPLTISGATLWLDAKDASTLTVDGSNRISEWRDKSGATYKHGGGTGNHHLIQNTANKQPTYVPNTSGGGSGAFSSKGGAVSIGDVGGVATYISSQYAWGATPGGHEATQFFVVSKRAHAGAGFAYPNYFYVGSFWFGYRYHDGSAWTNTRIRAAYQGDLNSTSEAVIGTKYLYTVTHKGTGVADTLRVNGSEEVATDINSNLDYTNTHHTIGSGNLLTVAEAEVAEVLFFDSVLSDIDRDGVEAYLIGKWGV